MLSTIRDVNIDSFKWSRYRRLLVHRIPSEWQSWLLDRGSLTQRLLQQSQGRFSVEVQQQRWQRPEANERKLLGLDNRSVSLIREVRLLGSGIPWVFARSILPIATLTGKERYLGNLGSKPLGAYLFKSRSMKRGPIEVGYGFDDSGKALWARRSIFYLNGKMLLVCEFFLPELTTIEARKTGCPL
ncbi:MAG: chorismate--pyruvate lyase [Gammaproteobacteria bacterium]|nr:MAG: chorismate--pyruvate lyase [Gammaproteobacteria bacterium]